MEVNRKRKLTKLLKQFPNNEQIAKALLTISYRRKTPKAPQWSHSEKNFVKLAKTFKCNASIIAHKVSEKKMFQLGHCAHDKEGNPVWSI